MQSRCFKTCLCYALSALLLASGCFNTNQRVKYFGRKGQPLEYYKAAATQVAYPTVDQLPPDEVTTTLEPRRLRRLTEETVRDLPLAEAIHLAMENSQVMRERGQFLSVTNPLLVNPLGNRSVFDPAIQESGVLLGNRGVEGALADFDTQFTTTMLWSRDEQVSNNLFLSGGLPPGTTLKEEAATFTSQLQKQLANGGQVTVSHNWDYRGSNTPGLLFPSVYRGLAQAEYRQPLWAGSGTEFTRIAGPIGQNLFGISGVSQGVLIARINSDISIAQFELGVRNLLKDVEDAYWDLALAYRTFDSETTARDSALATWREVSIRSRQGMEGGGLSDESQARDNYYANRARAEDALSGIYQAEIQLRRLIGLPVNDGCILRPCDEPSPAGFSPDWRTSLTDALTLRTELRQQKWNIKSFDLQLRAAKSLTRPRLDFVSNYHVNGFGDQLLDYGSDDDGLTDQGFNSAYESLSQGNQTGWNLGFEFSMPIGFRASKAQVRQLELQLAKARTTLSAQELEISHELATAFQNVDRWYTTAQTNYNRRLAALNRVEAAEAEFEVGRTTIDLVLRAQTSLAQAEIAYFQSLVEYNKAIAEVHFRKGTLLELNHVYLAEGGWEPEAYKQAIKQAWARTFAHNDPLAYDTTEPVSRNHPGAALLPMHEERLPAIPVPPRPEGMFDQTLPTEDAPQPERADEEINEPAPTYDRDIAPGEPEARTKQHSQPEARSERHGQPHSQPLWPTDSPDFDVLSQKQADVPAGTDNPFLKMNAGAETKTETKTETTVMEPAAEKTGEPFPVQRLRSDAADRPVSDAESGAIFPRREPAIPAAPFEPQVGGSSGGGEKIDVPHTAAVPAEPKADTIPEPNVEPNVEPGTGENIFEPAATRPAAPVTTLPQITPRSTPGIRIKPRREESREVTPAIEPAARPQRPTGESGFYGLPTESKRSFAPARLPQIGNKTSALEPVGAGWHPDPTRATKPRTPKAITPSNTAWRPLPDGNVVN